MTSKMIKLLFLMSFSLIVASCGNDDDAKKSGSGDDKPIRQLPPPPSGLTKQADSGITDDALYGLFVKKATAATAKKYNQMMADVVKAMKDHPTDKNKRDAAIDAAVGSDTAFGTEIKAAVDAALRVGGLKRPAGMDNDVYNLIANKSGLSDDQKNAILDAVQKAIRAKPEPHADRIKNIKEVVLAQGGDDAFAQEVIDQVDQSHPVGGRLDLAADAGLDARVHAAIVDRALADAGIRTPRSNLQLNAIMKAVAAAITKNAYPDVAAVGGPRNTAIIAAVTANGGANVPYSNSIIAAVDLAHGAQLTAKDEAVLVGTVYDLIVGDLAGDARTNTHKNNIIKAAIAAKGMASRNTQRTAIEAAIAVNGGADPLYSGPIWTAFEAAYAVNMLGKPESGIAGRVWDAIDGLADRTPEQKNAIIAVVADFAKRPPVAGDADLDAALNGADVAGDAMRGGTVKAAFNLAYRPAGVTFFHLANLDVRLYELIIEEPTFNPATKNALIAWVPGVMVVRPRVKANRDATFDGLLGAGYNVAFVNQLKAKAELAQPTIGDTDGVSNVLVDLAASDLRWNGLYDAVVRGLKPSNAQMNSIMPRLATILDARIQTKAARDLEIRNAVRAVIPGLPAEPAVLPLDITPWVNAIIGAMDLNQAASVLRPKPVGLPDEIYTAVKADKYINNDQVHTLASRLKTNIFDMAAVRRVKGIRDSAIETDVRFVLGLPLPNALTPEAQGLTDAISLAWENLEGSIVGAGDPTLFGLHNDVYNWVTITKGAAKTNAEVSTFLNALAVLVDANTPLAARVTGTFDAADAFGGLSDADKKALARLFLDKNRLVAAPAPRIAATVSGIRGDGIIVKVTGSTNPQVGPGLFDPNRVFIPTAKVGNLPLEIGDGVQFSNVTPGLSSPPVPGIGGFGTTTIKVITDDIVNIMIP